MDERTIRKTAKPGRRGFLKGAVVSRVVGMVFPGLSHGRCVTFGRIVGLHLAGKDLV
jgi:hypothetical protein